MLPGMVAFQFFVPSLFVAGAAGATGVFAVLPVLYSKTSGANELQELVVVNVAWTSVVRSFPERVAGLGASVTGVVNPQLSTTVSGAFTEEAPLLAETVFAPGVHGPG